MCRAFRGACVVMTAAVLVGLSGGGCAANARTVSAGDRETMKRAATLTAREWGYRLESETDAALVYRASQPMGYRAGNDPEELQVRTQPTTEGQTRVTVYFSGPTAGTEKYFLGDLQQNIEKVRGEPRHDDGGGRDDAVLASKRD